jgi:hypothetical protein
MPPPLWNYAQNFAMSDNSCGSQFGPSSPGDFKGKFRQAVAQDGLQEGLVTDL